MRTGSARVVVSAVGQSARSGEAPAPARIPAGLASPPVIAAAAALVVCTPFALAWTGVHWDDAYIFFRYAENLAAGHGLAFNPGRPSAGVTSLLWTALLALFARLAGPEQLPLFAKLAGLVCYAGACALTADAVRRWSGVAGTGIVAGLLLAANPLGVVLAVSGMDTGLALLLTAGLLRHWSRFGASRPFETGLLLGVLALARPDGLLLTVVAGGVVVSARYLRSSDTTGRRILSAGGGLALLGAGAVLLALPWLAYVHHLSGHWIPPTRIGKLIERLPWEHGVGDREFLALGPGARARLALRNLAALFGPRHGGTALLPVTAVLIAGAPAAAAAGRLRLGRGATEAIALTWACSASVLMGFCFLFPLPIPRYIASLLAFTTAGSCLLAGRLAGIRPDKRRPEVWDRPRVRRVLLVALAVWFVVPLVASWRPFLRASAAQQVRAEVGEWLAANTAPDAVVLLEPIGEIGFVSRRPIVDLGGLTDPAVWPHIERGESDVASLLALVDGTSPGWVISRPEGVLGSLERMIAARPERFVLRATLGQGDAAHRIYQVLPAR